MTSKTNDTMSLSMLPPLGCFAKLLNMRGFDLCRRVLNIYILVVNLLLDSDNSASCKILVLEYYSTRSVSILISKIKTNRENVNLTESQFFQSSTGCLRVKDVDEA
jgi:hypothetical protein